MRYGVPYKGSKNAIAEWIVSALPPAETFVDLFCGGCAVTHAALLSGKYKQFIINDIDGRVPKFFLDCCYGKYTLENHREWISREDFFRQIDDIYIALVWSFANNGKDYLYSKEREPYKKAMHYACFFDDLSLFEALGIHINRIKSGSAYEKYLRYKAQFTDADSGRNAEIERLQNMENIVRLQSLQDDYEDAIEKVNMQNRDNVLIYCDPPYKGTNCGKYQGFNSDRFYKWAMEQENIFISEYSMPDGFIPYAQKEKTVLSAASGNDIKANEIIFTNERTMKSMDQHYKQTITTNFTKQTSIFDFLGETA